MRLASFSHMGRSGYGIVVEGGVVDLSRRLGPAVPNLSAAISSGVLSAMAGIAAEAADVAMADVTLAMPVSTSAKIVCVGRNYRKHVAEGKMDLPEKPTVFLRAIDSFIPAGAALVRPSASDQFDYEGELAVVIGKPGRHIAKETALEHVFG